MRQEPFNDYIFDSRNRLTNVIALAADQNQRVQEEDVSWVVTTNTITYTTSTTFYTTTTDFDYDRAGNLIMRYNSSGMTDLYLPDATGGVAPLAHENSASVSWLLTDQNGSVQDMANANGTSLTYRALYDSFGQAEESSGTPSIFGYQGMMQSTTAPSGIFPLYYDNARWYDPATENFISQDPKGLGGGDTNLYRFVHNDPVNGMDPTGLEGPQADGSSAPGVNLSSAGGPFFTAINGFENTLQSVGIQPLNSQPTPTAASSPEAVDGPPAPQSGMTLNEWAASLDSPAISPVDSSSENLTPAEIAAFNAAIGPVQLPADAQHVGSPDPVIESDTQIQADATQAQQNLESQTDAYISQLEQQKLVIESQVAQAQANADYWGAKVAEGNDEAAKEQAVALYNTSDVIYIGNPDAFYKPSPAEAVVGVAEQLTSLAAFALPVIGEEFGGALEAGFEFGADAATGSAAENGPLASYSGGLSESTGSVTREGIVNGLTGFTDQGNAISASINSGATGLNVLGDDLFEQAYALKGGVGEAPQAFAYGEQIYVRQSSANLLSDVVHEGTHALDYLNGFDGSTIQLEQNAYSAERAFQQAGGGTVEFQTEQEMQDFINQNYKN